MLFAERRAMLPVLGSWFGATQEDADERCQQWLQQHPSLDRLLRPWAPPLIDLAMKGRLDSLGQRAHGRVALILLLDVFPRILYRGDARAYAGDLAAEGHVLQAVAQGQDRLLSPWERMVLYLPMMHAEDLSMQERSIREYGKIHLGMAGTGADTAAGFYDQAAEHHDIVKRFGRFPDRNAVLHRLTHVDERVFLNGTDRIWFAPQPVTGQVTPLITF